MKKTAILLIVLVGMFSASQAQLKPVKGDIGLGFKISGLENVSFNAFSFDAFAGSELLGRFYLSDRFVFRSTLGLNLDNREVNYSRNFVSNPPGSNPVEVDTSIVTTTSAFGISLSPGVEYHLASQASKLDPYVGAFIPFSFQGPNEVTEELDTRLFDQIASQVLASRNVTTTVSEDGGLRVGIAFLGGFNYFFSDNFAIGAEYSLNINSTSQGGKVKTTQVGSAQPTSDPTNIILIDSSTEFDRKNTSLSAFISTGGVNISIFW